jgi:hypothetical protein
VSDILPRCPTWTSCIHYFLRAYGINPVTTLTDWIDVLHLSSKWDYTAIRSAALQAIFPLASCVDKIVLAREYSLNDWMPSAVGELVTRKAGLTLDEGHRLGMEVVIAVAEARIDASKLARSPQKVDDVAKALSHALSTRGPYLVNEDALTDPAEAASKPFIQLSPNEDGSLIDNTVSDDDQRRLNEWAINALEHMAAGQQRILMHVQEYHSHVTAAVIAVLNSLWHEHDKCWKAPNRNTRLDITPHRSTTPSTFALLRTCSSVIDLDALIKDFCLERINGWVTVGGMATMPPRPFASALSQFDSGCTYSDANIISRASIDKLSLANDFIDMITTARAVRYVLDNAVVNHSGISKLVFANFWDKLLQLLHGMWAKQALEVANAIRVTLILMGRCASTNRACKEIEYFYEEVNKRAEGNSPAVQCLKVCHSVHPISAQLFRLISNDAVGHPKRTPMGGGLAF